MVRVLETVKVKRTALLPDGLCGISGNICQYQVEFAGATKGASTMRR